MAEKTLFPVFEVPEIVIPKPLEQQGYKKSVYFDFELGDFRRDGANKVTVSSGKDTYIQWCRKVVQTERFSCLSYGMDIGTEMDDAMSLSDIAAVESAIERTINEALMINSITEYVRGFEFQWNADVIFCSFVVKGKDWEEESMNIKFEQ